MCMRVGSAGNKTFFSTHNYKSTVPVEGVKAVLLTHSTSSAQDVLLNYSWTSMKRCREAALFVWPTQQTKPLYILPHQYMKSSCFRLFFFSLHKLIHFSTVHCVLLQNLCGITAHRQREAFLTPTSASGFFTFTSSSLLVFGKKKKKKITDCSDFVGTWPSFHAVIWGVLIVILMLVSKRVHLVLPHISWETASVVTACISVGHKSFS